MVGSIRYRTDRLQGERDGGSGGCGGGRGREGKVTGEKRKTPGMGHRHRKEQCRKIN